MVANGPFFLDGVVFPLDVSLSLDGGAFGSFCPLVIRWGGMVLMACPLSLDGVVLFIGPLSLDGVLL